MLIAAYAGCGKSTAGQKLGPNAVDLPSMPYRWLLPRVDPSCLTGPEMEREITEMGEEQIIWMWPPEDKAFACPVEDLDAPNVRETMDSIGKAAYERGLCPPRIFSEQVIRRYELIERVVWFKSMEGFYQAVITAGGK